MIIAPETQCWHIVYTYIRVETTWKIQQCPHNLRVWKQETAEVLDTLRSIRGRARLQEEELKAGEGQISNTMSKESNMCSDEFLEAETSDSC